MAREVNGASIPLVATTEAHHDLNHGRTPRQLLDRRGNHFDDIGSNGRYNWQRRYNYMPENVSIPLPRDNLHSFVASVGLT